MQHQWICAAVLCCIAFVLCALLLRALRKAHQNETCKNTASNLLVPGILGNNPISSGFALFGHTPTAAISNPMTSNQPVLQQTNETGNNAAFTTNPYNSTYAVTGNTNYSNAYGYAPINSVQQTKSNIQPTYADYGITNSALLPATTTTSDQTNPATNLIDSIYGTTGLNKVNQTAAYLNNQNNPSYTTNSSMNQPENDLSTNYNVQPTASMNLNNQAQFNLNSNLSNNLSSNLSRPPAYNHIQNHSNYSSYNSNNLINRQNRLPNIKNLSAINSTSTSSSSYSGGNNKVNSNNGSSSRNVGLNKTYGKSSTNLSNLNNLSYNNSNNQQSFNQMQPNYQQFQTPYFQQQQSHQTASNNSTTSSGEYGHTPLSLNNQWV